MDIAIGGKPAGRHVDCGGRVGVRACVRFKSTACRVIALLFRGLEVTLGVFMNITLGDYPAEGLVIAVSAWACVRACVRACELSRQRPV